MNGKALTLEELAQLTKAQLVGDPKHQIMGVADLQTATPADVSFLANISYSKAMRQTAAGAIFVNASTPLVDGKNFLIVNSPSEAFQMATDALNDSMPLTGFTGIHLTAVVHPTAKLGHNVTIGPQAVVDMGAVIGDNTVVGVGAYVGPYVMVGKDCYLHPRCVIREGCALGNRVILQPGAVIGSCGFGYTPNEFGQHIKLTHLAAVSLEDDVEVGANTTIDRGRLKPTTIKRGTKIDNLVQIAHGVVIGEDNIIVGQTGIAGSTSTGNHVVFAGQVAVNGHIHITDNVIVAARSAVLRSITKAGTYGGTPAIPMDEFRRQVIHLLQLASIYKELKERIEALECLAEKADPAVK
jgi:UDP-3-O-[3-hydroxymyristoyl] glucosamine N-acyltransferase